MGLRIQNNIEAFNTHRQLSATATQASKSMEKLSSGYRINRAADDAAGLGISEKMRGQIGGLAQAQRNVQDGISMVQTAEGALGEVHSMLQRVRDLKVQLENGTNDSADLNSIGAEVLQISQEVSSIITDTKFNGKAVFATSATAVATFQVGANDNEVISMVAASFNNAVSTATGGGINDLLTISTAATASDAAVSVDALTLSHIDLMINNVSAMRGSYGAIQNRMEHRLTNLATYQENLTASESRIRDVDMASEMTKFTKLNILQQAGTSMLAQANQAPQGVLSLLR